MADGSPPTESGTRHPNELSRPCTDQINVVRRIDLMSALGRQQIPDRLPVAGRHRRRRRQSEGNAVRSGAAHPVFGMGCWPRSAAAVGPTPAIDPA